MSLETKKLREIISNHGGRRDGSGRYSVGAKKAITRSLRMPPWMIEQMAVIDNERGFSALVRHAIVETYNLKEPE